MKENPVISVQACTWAARMAREAARFRASIEVMAVFQQLHQQGKTVILVTHEHDIAQYAQRMITFRDGRIISDKPNPTPRIAIEDLKNLPKLDEEE